MINGVTVANYSNVSFSGGRRIIREETERVDNKQVNDSFEPSQYQTSQRKGSPLWQKITAGVATFVFGMGVSTMVNNALKPENYQTLPAEFLVEFDLNQIAEKYNSDPDIILAYNGVDSVEELKRMNNFEIPPVFTGLEEKLEKINKKLASDDLDYDDRLILEDQKEAIRRYQEEQKKYAVAYEKDGYVYIILKDFHDQYAVKNIFGLAGDAFGMTIKEPDYLDDLVEDVSFNPCYWPKGTIVQFAKKDVFLSDWFNDLYKQNGFDFSSLNVGLYS